MKIEKQKQFIAALEQLYGPYDYDSALFGSSNYSKLSVDLCYSNSHFSKLISGGASEPMYDRALNNISKLQKLKLLEEQVNATKSESVAEPSGYWKKIALALLALVTMVSAYALVPKSEGLNTEINPSSKHPLEMYFDFNNSTYYKSPYLTDDQVHQFCPCSAFEGRWELDERYIIPVPYKIPGLYYVGKRADIRLKCRKTSIDNKGSELIGFENIENEIWFDTSMKPIDRNLLIENRSLFEKELTSLDLEGDESMVKIASVFSCFYDEIQITSDSIYRTGEPCGRYANALNTNILEEFNLDLNHIIEYIIGNMIFAQCAPIENAYCDPNSLENGSSLISFPCSCSIKSENLGFGGAYPYTKSIKLMEQNYQSNILCECGSNQEQVN